MTRWATALALAFAFAQVAPAYALSSGLSHVARAGDTPESIAAEYYGNRALALFIAEANAIQVSAKMKAGQRVKVPTAVSYRVKKGDTLEGLAIRLLDDRRRAAFLATTSGIKISDKLTPGQELLIPFQHVHRAEAPESLASIAKAFYGDPSKARMLAEYNFRSSPVVGKGERVVVPISHVRVRAVRMPVKESPAAAPTTMAGPTAELGVEKREAELAERVGARLVEAERAYKDGNYSDVPAQLDKLLAVEEPSESQLSEIFRLKAFAYVALGQEELAVSAFREVLSRRPDLKLDEGLTSPKIRAAFELAKKAPAP